MKVLITGAAVFDLLAIPATLACDGQECTTQPHAVRGGIVYCFRYWRP